MTLRILKKKFFYGLKSLNNFLMYEYNRYLLSIETYGKAI